MSARRHPVQLRTTGDLMHCARVMARKLRKAGAGYTRQDLARAALDLAAQGDTYTPDAVGCDITAGDGEEWSPHRCRLEVVLTAQQYATLVQLSADWGWSLSRTLRRLLANLCHRMRGTSLREMTADPSSWLHIRKPSPNSGARVKRWAEDLAHIAQSAGTPVQTWFPGHPPEPPQTPFTAGARACLWSTPEEANSGPDASPSVDAGSRPRPRQGGGWDPARWRGDANRLESGKAIQGRACRAAEGATDQQPAADEVDPWALWVRAMLEGDR